MLLPGLLLLRGHETVALLRADRETRYVEVAYLPEFTYLVAGHFDTSTITEWLSNDAYKPPYFISVPGLTEVPMIIAKDFYNAKLAGKSGGEAQEPGPRIAYSIQHPAPIDLDDEPEVKCAERAFEAHRANKGALDGQPAYDPRRASIWCVAAPGVKIDLPMSDKMADPPRIGIIRVQDSALVPAAGERFELGKFLRTNIWMLVRGSNRYEVLTNPSPDRIAGLFEPIAQIIEARDRPDGVDILVRTGAARSAFGFKVSIHVDPRSEKDRFWYGIEHEGNGPMRLRVAASGNVLVRLAPLRQEGRKPPESWGKFWYSFALQTYESAERVYGPQLSGSSNGRSGGEKFRAWLGDILDVSLTSLRIPFEGVQHLLWKLNAAIGATGEVQLVRQLSSPYFVLQRYGSDSSIYELPSPDFASIGMNVSDEEHPLASIADQLEEGRYATDGAAGTIVAGVTDLPQPLAEMAAAVVTGAIPLVGDAFDLVDAADLVFHGNAPDGTDPEVMDYLGLGVFALVSGASVYSGLKKTLTGARRSADYQAILKHLEVEAQTKLRELDDMVAGVKKGERLDEGKIRKLTLLLTDLNLDDSVPGMRPGYVFDDLISNTGFKHPWLESLYLAEKGDEADELLNVAGKRKTWLRSLGEDNDVRRLITVSLGEKLAKLEFLEPPVFNPESRLGIEPYRKSVDEYVALHRMLSADRLDAIDNLANLGRADLDVIARHHGPHGLGLEFDYDRFPIENLEAAAPDIVGEFRVGMPINWPVERVAKVGSGSSNDVRHLGLAVPGYRGLATVEQKASRVAYETQRLNFSSSQATRWRIVGNLLYYEKIKRLLDPNRVQFVRQKRDYILPAGYNPADPAATNWNKLEETLTQGGWYPKVEDRYNPIAEIPDDMLQFQLHRNQFGPPGGRSWSLPKDYEFDHEFIPQRVFYDLGMRGLVRDTVLAQITRTVIPADEIDDWLELMEKPEYRRAIRLKNQLNAQLGQASGRRLIHKHRYVHSEKDAYAASRENSAVMARLNDETYMRDMAHVPIDTLRLMARELDDANVGPIAPYLRWTVNQEFGSRNLMITDLPGARIPRDFRKPLDEYLEAVENGMDPDPPIIGYAGRQLPTAEDHERYIRMGRYVPTEYVPKY